MFSTISLVVTLEVNSFASEMPHQYGLTGFAQSPPSPPSQHGALLPRIGGGAVVPGNTGGSMTNTNSNAIYRPQFEDSRLTEMPWSDICATAMIW